MQTSSTILPEHISATERWMALGATSLSNPCHRLLLRELFEPLGLRCDYVVCEALSNERTLVRPVFENPRWRLEDVASEWLGICPSPAILPVYRHSVSRSGSITFDRTAGVGNELLRAMEQFADGEPLNAAIVNARTAAAKFLVKAFELTALPTAKPHNTAMFLDSPERFVEQLWRRLRELASAPSISATPQSELEHA